MHLVEQRPEPYLREVFAVIAAREGGLSMAQIQDRTELPDQAVRNAISTLIVRGFIDATSFRDRMPSLHQAVSITRGRFCVIGLKILPSEVLGVVTDLRCSVLQIGADGKELTELTGTKDLPGGQHDEEHVVRALAELVQELVEQIPEGYSVLGIGVELGGHVASDVVVYSPNLQWRYVPLGQRLEKVLPTQLKNAHRERSGQTEFPVVIENDANALAVEAQWFGAGIGRRSFALVLVGDGIGCGLVINNELLHGKNGIAGEIGHLVVAPENRGLICRCRNRGCLEAIATIPMILEAVVRAKKAYDQDPPATIAEAAKLAEEGDELAKEAFEFAGDALARAISYLLNLVNPEALILDTYEPKVTQLLMPTVKKRLQRYCFSTAQADCDIPIMDVALERGAKGAAAVMIISLLSQQLPRTN
jgi:predicted NBD/HSP70 family sugar kinase